MQLDKPVVHVKVLNMGDTYIRGGTRVMYPKLESTMNLIVTVPPLDLA